MPAKSSPPPESTPEAPPAKTDTPAAAPAVQAFRFTGLIPSQYLSVPLTARPADGDKPATVFAWPGGAPDDRWESTDASPNQLPDNAPANTSSEG